MRNVACWKEVPARPARYEPFPDSLDPRVIQAMDKRGVHKLYSHQHQAVTAALQGEDIVVVTPTASGKTLCYNLPVLDAILKNPDARALYLFPTKALSADQAAELYALIDLLGEPIKCYSYDGDTAAPARARSYEIEYALFAPYSVMVRVPTAAMQTSSSRRRSIPR